MIPSTISYHNFCARVLTWQRDKMMKMNIMRKFLTHVIFILIILSRWRISSSYPEAEGESLVAHESKHYVHSYTHPLGARSFFGDFSILISDTNLIAPQHSHHGHQRVRFISPPILVSKLIQRLHPSPIPLTTPSRSSTWPTQGI